MYRIGVWDHFSSAHYLRNYQGKCEHIHGHNWKVEVVLEGNTLDKSGMLLDFGILKKHLKEIMNILDHKCLNDDVEFFKEVSPSSENIARFIYQELSNRMENKDVKVYEVRVFESENSYAIYQE
ncbi:MAG: 6-carboxytetrahydropterin synthase QueD [Proteobacteria bacterium]|nr:6-carboxytetrahydropterin synthase QueD [Pseudomonadota bacterium]